MKVDLAVGRGLSLVQVQQRSYLLWTRDHAFDFCSPGVANCQFSVRC